jgi:phosphoglycolate phosphatase
MKMTPELKAVLFDLDGTLLDTAPDFATVLNAMLERHNRAPAPYQAIRQTVSHGARALVQLGFDTGEGDAGFEDLLDELLSQYQAHLSERTSLFEGMADLLQLIEAQRIPWGIVTNKPARYTDALLRDLQLAHRCATTICPDQVKHRKPHPESIYLACSKVGCEAFEAIYVGDHRRDIEAGINAGMPTIAAAYGYVTEADPPHRWGADRVANTVHELQFIIRERLGLLL